MAVVPPCISAVPNPRTRKVPAPACGQQMEVVQVLRDAEAGSHGEAADRRVHQEADAVRANQRHQDQRLEQLLADRGDVPGKERQPKWKAIEEEVIRADSVAAAMAAPVRSRARTVRKRISL